MDNGRRIPSPGFSSSPGLIRSRSGAPTARRAPAPESQPLAPNSSRNSITRSRSTSKVLTGNDKDDENRNPKLQEQFRKSESPTIPILKRPEENRESFTRAIRPNGTTGIVSKGGDTVGVKPRKVRSATSSPSAWALSPGRSPQPTPAENALNAGALKQRSGGMSGMLRFFKQKKMPSAREETIDQFRILQTRLLQWRFMNARMEAGMAAGKSVAEKKLFSVWLETFRLRNSVMEKKIQVQKLKAEMKLRRILNFQIQLLNEWERIDKKNSEAVTKSGTILQSACVKLPLAGGAKANIFSVYRTFCTAMEVVNGMEEIISRFFFQAEKMSSLLTELVMVVKQERESLDNLVKTAALITSMKAQEGSLRAHLMQAMKDKATFQAMAFCRFANTRQDISFPSAVILSRGNISNYGQSNFY